MALQSNVLKQDILYKYMPGGTLPFGISGILVHEGEMSTNATLDMAFQHLLDNDLFLENAMFEKVSGGTGDEYFSIKVVPSVESPIADDTRAILGANASSLTLGISKDYQAAKFFSLVPRNICTGPVETGDDSGSKSVSLSPIKNEFHGTLYGKVSPKMEALLDAEYLLVSDGKLYGISDGEQTEISFVNFSGTQILLAKFARTSRDSILVLIGERDGRTVAFYVSPSEYSPLYGESLREVEAVYLDGAPSGAKDLIDSIGGVFSGANTTVMSTNLGILELADFQGGMPRQDRVLEQFVEFRLPAPATVKDNALLDAPTFSTSEGTHRLRSSAKNGQWDESGAYEPEVLNVLENAENLGNAGKYVWNDGNRIYEQYGNDVRVFMDTSLPMSSLVGVGKNVALYRTDGQSNDLVCEIPKHRLSLNSNEPWNATDYDGSAYWLYGEMTKYQDLPVSAIVSRMDKTSLEGALESKVNDIVQDSIASPVPKTIQCQFTKKNAVDVGVLFSGRKSSVYDIRSRFANLSSATVSAENFYEIQNLDSIIDAQTDEVSARTRQDILAALNEDGQTKQAVPSILGAQDDFFSAINVDTASSGDYSAASSVLLSALVSQTQELITPGSLVPSAGSGISEASESGASDEISTGIKLTITVQTNRHVLNSVQVVDLSEWPDKRIYIDPDSCFVYNNNVYRSLAGTTLVIDPLDDSDSAEASEVSDMYIISPEDFDTWASEEAQMIGVAWEYDEDGNKVPADNIENLVVEIPFTGGNVKFDIVAGLYGVKSVTTGTAGTPTFTGSDWKTSDFDVDYFLVNLREMMSHLGDKELELTSFSYYGDVDQVIQKPDWASQDVYGVLCSLSMTGGTHNGNPWDVFADEFSRMNVAFGQITGVAASLIDIGPSGFVADHIFSTTVSFTPGSMDYSGAVSDVLLGAVGFVIARMQTVNDAEVHEVSPMTSLTWNTGTNTFQQDALQALANELNSRPRLLSFDLAGGIAPDKFYNIQSNGDSSFWGICGRNVLRFNEKSLGDFVSLNCQAGTGGGDFVEASDAEMTTAPGTIYRFAPASTTASIPVLWIDDAGTGLLHPYMSAGRVFGVFRFYDRNTSNNEISEHGITSLAYLETRGVVWVSVDGSNDIYEFNVSSLHGNNGAYDLKKWECVALYKTAFSGAVDWRISSLRLSDRDESTLTTSSSRTMMVTFSKENAGAVQYFAFSDMNKESVPGSRLALTNVFEDENLHNAHVEVGAGPVDGVFIGENSVIVMANGEMTEFSNNISQPMYGSPDARVHEIFTTSDPMYTSFYLDSTATLVCLDFPEDMLGLYPYSRIRLTDFIPALLEDQYLSITGIDMSEWHIGQTKSPIYVHTTKGVYTVDMGMEIGELPYETDDGVRGFFSAKASSMAMRHIEKFHKPESILERFNAYRLLRNFYKWYEMHPFAKNGAFESVTGVVGEDGRTFSTSGRDWTGSVRCWTDCIAERTVSFSGKENPGVLFAAISSPLLEDDSWTKTQISSPIKESGFYDCFVKIAETEGGNVYVEDSENLDEIPFSYRENSDMTWDLYATIPTTMTPYMNRVEGTYADGEMITEIDRSSRKNLGDEILTSGVVENATTVRLYLDTEFFKCHSVQEVEISGSSLPMYIYRDADANDGHYDSVALQSVFSNNISRVDDNGNEDDNGKWTVLEFMVWGSDEQSVHVRGRSGEIYDTEVRQDDAGYHIYYSSIPFGTKPEDWEIETMPTMDISTEILAEDGLNVPIDTSKDTFLLAIPVLFARSTRWLSEDGSTVVTPVSSYTVVVDGTQYAVYVWDTEFYGAQTVLLKGK